MTLMFLVMCSPFHDDFAVAMCKNISIAGFVPWKIIDGCWKSYEIYGSMKQQSLV